MSWYNPFSWGKVEAEEPILIPPSEPPPAKPAAPSYAITRSYWRELANGRWEFLGAFSEGHQVRDENSPMIGSAVIDIHGASIQGVLDRLAGRVILENLPDLIQVRMARRGRTALAWEQIEGYVK